MFIIDLACTAVTTLTTTAIGRFCTRASAGSFQLLLHGCCPQAQTAACVTLVTKQIFQQSNVCWLLKKKIALQRRAFVGLCSRVVTRRIRQSFVQTRRHGRLHQCRSIRSPIKCKNSASMAAAISPASSRRWWNRDGVRRSWLNSIKIKHPVVLLRSSICLTINSNERGKQVWCAPTTLRFPWRRSTASIALFAVIPVTLNVPLSSFTYELHHALSTIGPSICANELNVCDELSGAVIPKDLSEQHHIFVGPPFLYQSQCSWIKVKYESRKKAM